MVLLSEKAEAATSGDNKRKPQKIEQLCDRCGRLLEMVNKSRHIQVCYGKCNNCHDQDIACHRKGGEPCRNCVEKKLEREGASHGHLAVLARPFCSRCKVRRCSTSENAKHEANCIGRCRNCQDSDVPCTGNSKSINKGCDSCKDKGLTCDRQYSHGDLENLEHSTCQWCGQLSSSLGDKSLILHASTCGGKCSSCAEKGIPCIFLKQRPPCEDCATEGLQCSGRTSRREELQNEESNLEACPKCDVRHVQAARHLLRCKGKCSRCAELDIPCSRGNGPQCRNCKADGTECQFFGLEA